MLTVKRNHLDLGAESDDRQLDCPGCTNFQRNIGAVFSDFNLIRQ